MKFKLSILLVGDTERTGSNQFTVDIEPGLKQTETTVTFANKLSQFPSPVYRVYLMGLPGSVSGNRPWLDDQKYALSYNAWINRDGGITINVIWHDVIFVPFYPLPEDEIGAYYQDPFGNKTYLLFHTYDICMDWLGSDELCSGYERCFHKEIPYIYDGNKVWGK